MSSFYFKQFSYLIIFKAVHVGLLPALLQCLNLIMENTCTNIRNVFFYKLACIHAAPFSTVTDQDGTQHFYYMVLVASPSLES